MFVLLIKYNSLVNSNCLGLMFLMNSDEWKAIKQSRIPSDVNIVYSLRRDINLNHFPVMDIQINLY